MSIIYTFIIGLLLAVSAAQNCDNPLRPLLEKHRDQKDMEKQFESHQFKEGSVESCRWLNNKNSCCTKKFVNNFDEVLQEHVKAVEQRIIPKEVKLFELLGDYNDFSLAHKELQKRLTQFWAEVNYLGVTLNIRLGSYIKQAETLAATLQPFEQDLQQFQSARQTCLKTLFNVTAAMLCIGCDPEYESKGVRREGEDKVHINLHTHTCKVIQRECYPYIELSWRARELLKIKEAVGYITAITQRLNKTIDSKIAADLDLPTPLNELKFTETDDNKDLLVDKPPSCVSTHSCEWACHNFLHGFAEVNSDIITLGGVPLTEKRLLDTQTEITYSIRGFDTSAVRNLAHIDYSVRLNPSDGKVSGQRLLVSSMLALLSYLLL